jgi:hypothetical protein
MGFFMLNFSCLKLSLIKGSYKTKLSVEPQTALKTPKRAFKRTFKGLKS